MRWFFNQLENQTVTLNSESEVIDPDTGEVFGDLTVEKMAQSDDWFEYDGDPRGFNLNSLKCIGVRPNGNNVSEQ